MTRNGITNREMVTSALQETGWDAEEAHRKLLSDLAGQLEDEEDTLVCNFTSNTALNQIWVPRLRELIPALARHLCTEPVH